MVRVLIADDSSFMRRVLREILSDGGYQVVSECENGVEAFECYDKFQPDLVLLDYNMPRMNGLQGARKILADYPKADIVMVTSIVKTNLILEALRLGVKNYITKPFDERALLITLQKVLGNKAPVLSSEIDEEKEFSAIGSSFGQYLLQKGVIGKDQLLHILEIQLSVNCKIGQIAVDEGFLLPRHINSILKMQKRINKHFGQLAIQMGLLSNEQVEYLLERQKETQLSLEDILVREKILSQQIVDQEQKQFLATDESEQGIFNLRWVSAHIQNGIIFEVFIEQTLKLLMRLGGFFVMEGESSLDCREFAVREFMVKVAVAGDSHWSYYLNMSSEIVEHLAGAMLEEDIYDENALVEAAKEFANITCGNAVGKLDARGTKFDFVPPVVKKHETGILSFSEREQVLLVPILAPVGEMELIVAGADIFRPIDF